MSKWLIIGSVAMRHWFSDARIPADIDLLTPATFKSSDLKECFVDSQWHSAAELIKEHNTDPVFATPDMLLTLKLSHAHWDIKWQKTVFDIEFLKRKGAKVIEQVYEALIPVWIEIHGKKHVKMNVPIKEFFDDAVKRKYDHEYLHEVVAFTGQPHHVFLRPDTEKAYCSIDRWNLYSLETKMETCLEEIMVTAIERFNLVSGMKKSEYMAAMSKAHFKLCTSMTKGWFSRFLIYNRFELLTERKEKWQQKLQQALTHLNG